MSAETDQLRALACSTIAGKFARELLYVGWFMTPSDLVCWVYGRWLQFHCICGSGISKKAACVWWAVSRNTESRGTRQTSMYHFNTCSFLSISQRLSMRRTYRINVSRNLFSPRWCANSHRVLPVLELWLGCTVSGKIQLRCKKENQVFFFLCVKAPMCKILSHLVFLLLEWFSYMYEYTWRNKGLAPS